MQQFQLPSLRFFLHGHPAESSWGLSAIQELDVIPGTNPKLHKAMATVELKDMDSQLQQARQGPMELLKIMMCMANIISIALRLSVKLGAQCQLGVLLLHEAKPPQEMGEVPSPEVSMGICRVGRKCEICHAKLESDTFWCECCTSGEKNLWERTEQLKIRSDVGTVMSILTG